MLWGRRVKDLDAHNADWFVQKPVVDTFSILSRFLGWVDAVILEDQGISQSAVMRQGNWILWNGLQDAEEIADAIPGQRLQENGETAVTWMKQSNGETWVYTLLKIDCQRFFWWNVFKNTLFCLSGDQTRP